MPDIITQLEKINEDYKAQKEHTTAFVVTKSEGDNPDGSKTVNYYVSITTSAEAVTQKPT